MKLLFVCRANVGRSQAAMELYRLSGGEADSAGTKVNLPGTTLVMRPGSANIVSVMQQEYGVDMSQNVRTQITPQNAAGYDEIIVMAEKETIPEWLLADSRTVIWDIDDAKDQDIPTTRRIVHEIEQKIQTEL